MTSTDNKITVYRAISPDGFDTTMDKTWATEGEALAHLDEWVYRYGHQGYYSSLKYGRIPMDEIKSYCSVVPLVIKAPKYKVFRVSAKTSRRTIIEKNLTLEQARRLVDSFPSGSKTMVCYSKQ